MTHRGIHTRPNDGETNDWLTPPHVIEALGEFDLDPCAHPGQQNRTARRMISPPRDGLKDRWRGRVWLNPPYGGQLKAWLGRLCDHGDGIALVPARTEVESWFWPYCWEGAGAILFLRGRLYFLRPDGSKAGNAGHGSCLVAYGPKNVASLGLCKIPGKLIVLP